MIRIKIKDHFLRPLMTHIKREDHFLRPLMIHIKKKRPFSKNTNDSY